MRVTTVLRRFFLPGWYVTLVCLWRFRAQVSPRAEVELSPMLRLGRGTVIGSFTKVKAEQGVFSTGSAVRIANGCFLDAHAGGLSIGNGALIGANCVIVAVAYKYSRIGIPLAEQGQTSRGIVIGDNVFIGSNSTVLDGSHLENDVIIAPGSVVSGTVPAGAIFGGNPARLIFQRRP